MHASLLAMHGAPHALLACAYQGKTQRGLMWSLATHKIDLDVQNEMLQATANEEIACSEEVAQPGAAPLSADDPGAALSALSLLGGTPKLKLHCC